MLELLSIVLSTPSPYHISYTWMTAEQNGTSKTHVHLANETDKMDFIVIEFLRKLYRFTAYTSEITHSYSQCVPGDSGRTCSRRRPSYVRSAATARRQTRACRGISVLALPRCVAQRPAWRRRHHRTIRSGHGENLHHSITHIRSVSQ